MVNNCWYKIRPGRGAAPASAQLNGSGNAALLSLFVHSDYLTLPCLAVMILELNRDRNALRGIMTKILRNLWAEDQGQDIAEYAVMLAVILVIVVGTLRVIGSNANNVFSSVASSVQ